MKKTSKIIAALALALSALNTLIIGMIYDLNICIFRVLFEKERPNNRRWTRRKTVEQTIASAAAKSKLRRRKKS